MWRRNERINERDVPESQHTIFIRGLPGNMGTDELREFFEKDYGSCSFDFVKMSPDRSKLYVAIRFDSKSSAREVMEKYATDGELLGYKVELSWFRDIRRYLAHCAKQGVRPARFGGRGGRGGGGFRSGGRSGGYGGGGGDEGSYRAARNRGHSRSSAHSRSQSAASKGSRDSYSRSRSPDSRSPSRSKSVSSKSAHSTPRSEREKSLDYSDIVKRERPPTPSPSPPPPPPKKKSRGEKRKRERKQKRRRSPSPVIGSSEMEESDDDEVIPVNVTANGSGKKVLNGGSKHQSPQQQHQQQNTFSQRHLAVGTVADSFMAKQQQQQNNSIFLDMSEPKKTSPPKFKQPIYDSSSIDILINGGTDRSSSPPSPAIRNMPSATQKVMANGSGGSGSLPIPLNNFKEIQHTILQDVRWKPQEDTGDEDGGGGLMMGSLRLSSLSRKARTEAKREERVAKLSPELRERVNKKKRQLELSYRNDCETYGLVAKKLIAKDRALEDRLKVALLETMKELEVETLKQLDDFLDQISFMF